MIDLEKTVFILDGPTEVYALRDKFQKEFGVSINPRIGITNGKDIKPEVYANALIPKVIPLLSDRFHKIIILMDKEKRPTGINTLSSIVKKELISKLCDKNKRYKEDILNRSINIIVSDIMFENWIIADIVNVSKDNNDFKKGIKQEKYDGKHGTGELEKMMTKAYKKTIDGPILFKKIRINIARKYSESFNVFLKTLEI